MTHQPNRHSVGRKVDFIELHMDLFSRRYFACLQDAVDANNTLGWGMDFMLPGLCGGLKLRSELVAGTWPHVPPGCSYSSGGDNAAHYNRGSGGGADFTIVCAQASGGNTSYVRGEAGSTACPSGSSPVA